MRNLLSQVVIFLIFFQYTLYATNREFSRLTIEDGLSQSSIFDIMQDEKGYLWVTTQDGLNRYDGYSFKVFRHSIVDSQSISDNSLGKILSDKNGDIWVSSIHGNMNQYHYGKNRFSSYPLGELNGIQDDASFISMVHDSSGSIWFAIKGAIGKFNPATKKTSIYRTYFPGKVITSPHLFIDKKNNIWAGDKYGLYLYNTKDNQFELFRFRSKTSGFLKNIVAITEGEQGELWLGVKGHAPFRLNIKSRKIVFYEKQFSAYALSSFNKITAILYTSTQEVVLGTFNNGVYILNPQSGRVEHLINNPLDKKSISFNYILSLYEDSAQNLWVGTLKGLNKLDLKPKKFETFRFGTLNAGINNNRVPIDVVLSVYRDSKKNVWLGTYSGGLYIIDGKTNRISTFTLLPFKGTEVWAVRELSDGKYLLGTDKGLNLIDLEKKKFQYIPYELDGEETEYMVRDIVPYKKNKYWVGSLDKGVLLFDLSKKSLSSIASIEKNKKTELDVLSLFTDHAGVLWIGTRLSGLYYYNPKIGLFSAFQYNDNRLKREFKRINSIVEDREKNIWVATENGLICVKDDRKEIVHYSTKEGLLNSFIYSVEIDKKNNVWVSTNGGLSRIHFNKYGASLVYNYTMEDGLQANEFDTNCSFMDDDGKLYFGGIEGLNVFDPQKIYKNPHVPIVTVNRVIVNKNIVSPTKGQMEIVLKPYYSNLEFSFSALDFTNTENNQYAYKLVGFDPDWVYSGVRNSVRYTGLTPGNYVFYVKGTNNDGVWSENIEYVNVVVSTPLWETLWARILYIFVLILVVILLIVLRTRKVIKDKIVLNKKVKQITGELQANYRKLDKTKTELINSVKRKAVEVLADGMAHDFNNLLFVILNSAQLLKNGVDTPEKKKLVENIEVSAVDAAAVIKRVQDFSTKNDRVAQDVVDVSGVLLNAIDLIKAKTDEIEKKKSIVINIKKSIDVNWISFGSLSEFRLALTNILINAIESFEKSGTIMVNSSFDGKGKGVIEISDEGKGMDKETVNNIFDPFFTTKGVHNSGLGLSQAYGIVTRHNGTIMVDSRPGEGTKIIINLPAKLKINDLDELTSEKQTLQTDISTDRESILVVEDEAVIRELYGEILSMQGYHSEMAETGEEGVEKWESGQYNLVICDLGLPGLLSGWDVIEKIREKDNNVPVLVVTGWGNSIEKSKIERYQVNKVLSKPVPVKELLSEISVMLN